jgi:hypothetical protein
MRRVATDFGWRVFWFGVASRTRGFDQRTPLDLDRIDSILATLGVKSYRALRRDRREQLALLRQPDRDPVPQAAQIRIERLLDRLELTLRQIKEIEAARELF